MTNLNKLFSIIELTRFQPQYGWGPVGISKGEQSDLAQHGYMVTYIAWILGLKANQAGAKLNLGRIMELAMVHDLGELFGGDIAMPYAKANPDARQAAKAFEAENIKFINDLHGEDKKYFNDLTKELESGSSDEALVARVADYIELAHYKLLINHLDDSSVAMYIKKIQGKIDSLKDEAARTYFQDFNDKWPKEIKEAGFEKMFDKIKRK
ncbi:HD domain-containing protein [Patescibacteria group bacterium]